MPQSRIDNLIGALGDFSKALGDVNKTLGQFSSDIRTLYKRADEDREERRREQQERREEHAENQVRMGEIAQAAASSISELRRTATKRWDETGSAVEKLSGKIDGLSDKLDEHAATVSRQQKTISALQMGRGKLLFLASIGGLAIIVIGWAVESGFQWLIEHFLKTKFGG